MVEGFEQYYQNTAEKISDLLASRLSGDFEKVWLHAVMQDSSGDVVCYYKQKEAPGKMIRVTDEGLNIDLYLVFRQLRENMKQVGEEPWSTVALMLMDDGRFGIELGFGDPASKLEQSFTPVDILKSTMARRMPELSSFLE